MAELKTKQTNVSVRKFINSFADTEQKRRDSFRLTELMQGWSGFKPKMWGPSIIGFGKYHYKYESGHEGDMPLLGFSPRKAAFSLYVFSSTKRSEKLLAELGKFKKSKACIYVKKLSDINISILKELCLESIKYTNEHYACSCREK